MQTDSLRAVIALEDSAPDVLETTIGDTGAFLWPLVRWPLISSLNTVEVGVVPAPGRVYRGQVLREQLGSVLPSRHSLGRLRPVDHLFVVHGATVAGDPAGLGNWLTDELALSLGRSAAVLQDLPIAPFSARAQHPLNPRTHSFAAVFAKEYRERRFRAPSPETLAEVTTATAAMIDALDIEVAASIRDQVQAQVASRVVRLSPIARAWERLLDRVKPRRIYMQTAAYGDRSNLIRLAHERGIRVAELQHGWVGSAHGAYNFGAAMHQMPLLANLPDQLLTFGDFWGESLRFPGEVTVIGKPVLEQAVARAQPWPERPRQVLVVSSAYARETVTQYTLALAQALPADWRVVLRPHPSERHLLDALYPEVLAAGIEIDQVPDVTESIARSRAILGLTSTVLYEALPFGVHIGVIDSDLSDLYAATDLFPQRLSRPEDVSRFAMSIQQDPSTQTEALARRVWGQDPIPAFLREAGR